MGTRTETGENLTSSHEGDCSIGRGVTAGGSSSLGVSHTSDCKKASTAIVPWAKAPGAKAGELPGGGASATGSPREEEDAKLGARMGGLFFPPPRGAARGGGEKEEGEGSGRSRALRSTRRECESRFCPLGRKMPGKVL